MPELPEVEALAGFLRQHAVGRAVSRVDVVALAVLKTVDPPPTALAGLTVTAVARHGKLLDLDVDGLHLVVHFSRAGWLQWRDPLPAAPPRRGRGPLALRVGLVGEPSAATGAPGAGGAGGPEVGVDLTEAGTQKRLAVHVVRDPAEVPAIAALGPDPLAADFDVAALEARLAGLRARLKNALTDQRVLAGIGNAYSDDILHAARLSPFATAGGLAAEELARLHAALRQVLGDAVAEASGRPPGELKDGKRGRMRVHGRTGESCGVCGDTVAEVSLADSSFQYCPSCQTGGRTLADRRMSRLLK